MERTTPQTLDDRNGAHASIKGMDAQIQATDAEGVTSTITLTPEQMDELMLWWKQQVRQGPPSEEGKAREPRG